MAGRVRLRTDRVVLAVGVLVLVVATVLYYVIQRGKLGDLRLASDKTLLSLLTVTVFGLLLGLAVVLVRNLARVLASRREGLLGSRLQFRVTAAFLILVLIPSLFLFITAIGMVRKALSDVAGPDLTRTVRTASEVAEDRYRHAEETARHFARQLARDLGRGPLAGGTVSQGEISRQLQDALRRYRLDAVGVFVEGGKPLAVAAVPRGGAETVRTSELNRLPDGLVEGVLARGQGAAAAGEMAAFGWRVVAAEPVPGQRAVAWATLYVDEDANRKLGELRRANEDVQVTGRRRAPIERLYIGLFALLTFVVLFAAVWAGLLIARQVTGPIVELARGTEALARGELSYRVTEFARDELGQLASSFNRMAREIERNRGDLEARRNYIETLLESIPVGVLSLDGKGRVTTANRSAVDVLRLDELAPGTALDEALGGGHGPLLDALAPVLAGETDRLQTETSIEGKDGVVALMLAASRFPAGRAGEGILVVLDDLTSLRRAERLAAWGEVARRLAHEIKNPLTPIRLSAERMLRRYRKGDEDLAPVIEEGVATIVREVEGIQALVSEFSRYARLPEIRPRPVALGPVVEDAVTLYRNSHTNVEFALELAAELPPHRIDPDALRRALINLLDNAVAAVGSGGHITVRTRHDAARRRVVLEVADDGPGVAPEDRARLFQPDFTRRPGGTGLGLAIVEQIVAGHGGRVRVAGNAGGGTRFIIELPVAAVTGERDDAARTNA